MRGVLAMAAVTVCRVLAAGVFTTPGLVREELYDHERRRFWIIHRYDHAVVERTAAVLVGIGHLNEQNRGIANGLIAERLKFDIFNWYIRDEEAVPTYEELEMHVPSLVFARRSFKPMCQSDYSLSIQCFGHVISRPDMQQIIAGENRMNLGNMLIRRFIVGYRYVDMMFTRLWATNTDVTFLNDEFLRECLLCSIRFPTNRHSIDIVTKVGTEHTNVRLLYRGHHEYADTLADIIRWESQYGGTIIEMGHVVSWYCENANLSIIRLCRAVHRHLRNRHFQVPADDIAISRDILIHCLRSCNITIADLGTYYRVLNVLDAFDPRITTEINALDVVGGYDQTHIWLKRFFVPSAHQLREFRVHARTWLLDLTF